VTQSYLPQRESREALSPATRAFINFPVLDWAGAVIVFALVSWLSLRHPEAFGQSLHWRIGWIRDLDAGTRTAVFQTMTALSGTLLGLTLTSVSILAGLMKQDLATATRGLLTPRRQKRVSRLFFAGLRGLAVALLVSFALMGGTGDQVSVGPATQALAFTVTLFAVARLGRIVWVLALVLDASVPTGAQTAGEYPLISDDEY
jgi:hypothetical protein